MKLRQFVDRLFRRADASLHQLEARQKNILTIVSVVTMTAPKTFSGPAVLVTPTAANTVVAGGAVAQSRADSSAAATTAATSTAEQQSSDAASSTAAQSSAAPADTSSAAATTSQAAAVSSPSSAGSSNPSTLSSVHVTVAPSTTFGTAASSSATTAAKESSSPQSGGMTGGAKAGLAFGIILLLGALLAGVILLYRRKKQQMVAHERLDDEKTAMARPDALPSFPEPVPAPASRFQESPGMAPQLSLRPVTQFDPRMSSAMGPVTPESTRAASLAATSVAGAAVAGTSAANSSSNSNSAWEKRGAERHANDPSNPFGNHAETVNGSPPHGSPVKAALGVSAATAAGAALAADAQKRSPSPGRIDAADFPLPASGPPSPNPITSPSQRFINDATTPALASADPAASTVSIPPVSIPTGIQGGEVAAGAAGVVAAAGVAGAAVAAGKSNGPPADNVHRVQLDFKPSMEDELEIRAGQLVRMLHEYDDGWALCTLMDRSQQGVVPRTCLSKHVMQPRPAGPPQGPQGRPGPNGPPRGGPPQMRGPPNGPGPYSQPGSGRNSPAPFAQAPRPLTPTGRNSPAPYPGGRASPAPYPGGRASPAPYPGGRASPAPFAQIPPPLSPGGRPAGRARAASNASPYIAYQPQGRSMSPGPYGASQLRPAQRPDNQRRRSNSMSNLAPSPNSSSPGASPPGSSPNRIPGPVGQIPTRKPVAGQAQ